ncbi:MAG: hypothetical protein HQ541_10525 [Mariniphaga sp.]|nr:hypothetical protein [Mariniphaga sp.]
MRLVITIAVLSLFVACNTLEFEVPNEDSVMTAYIGDDFWAADSLAEAYYFENTLYISAKGGNEDLIIKIENPLIGDNSNIEFIYNGKTTNNLKSASSTDIQVYLNVLDTVNAQPSIVNGTFSGQITLSDGDFINIKEGKINNVVTETLFCENNIRSYSTTNTDIGGKWELVKIVNKRNGTIQNPTCKSKVFLNFYNEDYLIEKIDQCDCNFEIEGPQNSLWGNFEILEEANIDFYNQEKTTDETTGYNGYLEELVFDCITNSNAYFISNTLMHLESPDFISVFYRKN